MTRMPSAAAAVVLLLPAASALLAARPHLLSFPIGRPGLPLQRVAVPPRLTMEPLQELPSAALLKAIADCDSTVTAADVAATAGMEIAEARRQLLVLARLVGAELQVSEDGEVSPPARASVCSYRRRMRAFLRAKAPHRRRPCASDAPTCLRACVRALFATVCGSVCASVRVCVRVCVRVWSRAPEQLLFVFEGAGQLRRSVRASSVRCLLYTSPSPRDS